MVTFRKTREGKWVAFGPVDEVQPGPVNITKRDGAQTTRTVTSVGRPFDARGVLHVYGYLAEGEGRYSYNGRNGRCRECGGPIRNAAHCQAHSGWCGECAFDCE